MAVRVSCPNSILPPKWTCWLSKLFFQLLCELYIPCRESPSLCEDQLCCLTQQFDPPSHAPHLISPVHLFNDCHICFKTGFDYTLVEVASSLNCSPAGQSLFSSSCHPIGGQPQPLLSERNPTSAISTLYSILLTSPWIGAVSTAIELTSSSQTSVNMDKAAFLEAASAFFWASVHICRDCLEPLHKIVDWYNISSYHSPGVTSSSQLEALTFFSITLSFRWF